MNTPKDSFGRSSNDALSLPALKGEVSHAKTMRKKEFNDEVMDVENRAVLAVVL